MNENTTGGVCPKCTMAGGAHYLTCPVLRPGYRPGPSRDAVPATPNPGSYEAAAQGCCCAVLDNNHGKTPPLPPDGWWITQGCPVHAPRPARRVS